MPRKKNDEGLSAASWVKRNRRRQTQDEEPVADQSQPEYTAKDLAGIRVAHSIDAIDEGSEQVLTLQDQTIDELDDTEESVRLENSLLSDRKRAQKNAERRERANPLYGHDTAHDALDDEDEEQGFVISEEIKPTENDGRLVQSAESEAPAVVSDFVQFKKPRRDKRKARRAQTSTNDFVHVDSERVNAILSRKTQIDDSSFIDDDDDLQRAIARVRRAQKPKHEVVGVQSECVDMEVEESAGDEGLLLSGTIEFVQGLRAAVSESKDDEEEEARIVKRPRKSQPSEIQPELKPETESKPGTEFKPEPESVIEQEPSVGMGLAGTLTLLRQRNMLDTLTDEQRQREAQTRGRDQWMSSHLRQELELQKERQRIKQMHKQEPDSQSQSSTKQRRGKADAMTQRELEELKQRDQDALDRKWAREYEERMRDYKPDVRLEYVDDVGRQLTTKEAYKQLSHAFHGHYSGKNKVDKVMKKHERERRQNELASTSVTHEHSAEMEAARRKLGSAGIVYLTNDKPNNS
ncbi:hypothetical protein GGH96_005784 [Coemansia sp. RSA 1972]|nr:hypothetical protein GGH96_005784 [Coemansia sp. RSA 1972]